MFNQLIYRYFFILFACSSAAAQTSGADGAGQSPAEDASGQEETAIDRGRQIGLSFDSDDGDFALRVSGRTQFRLSDPFDGSPASADAFAEPGETELSLYRARIQARGHVFTPRIRFGYQQGLENDPRLLDLYLEFLLTDALRLRVGQYKLYYGRERLDSSRAQQLVDRSIVNRPFTVDRQRGITLMGRIGAKTRFDSSFWIGAFAGGGRDPGSTGGSADSPMVVARYQWNVLGKPVEFAQSDHTLRQQAALSLGFGVSTVTGPYTRYSSSGGGQLAGFEAGSGDRYDVDQWFQDFAWRYAGYAVQQEFHRKRIEDNATGTRRTLAGGYLQAGKTWLWQIGQWRKPLEAALRYAQVDLATDSPDDAQREFGAGLNLFFEGNDNKLSLDVGRISLEQPDAPDLDDVRWRLQWDFTF